MPLLQNVLKSAALISVAWSLGGCASFKITKSERPIVPAVDPAYESFKAQPGYPKTYGVWTNQTLFPATTPENSRIKISLATQRGLLLNGDQVVLDYPICSGIKSRPTPTGTFYILEKIVSKKSNRYGKFYDSEGKMVNSNADVRLDALPEGGRFEGADMNYWMRLTQDGVGHHIGPVLRSPASHACVRGPAKTIPLVFEKVKTGTRVDIE
jgi:hypothetical protein